MGSNENTLHVTSSAFQHEGKLPSKYSCDGEGINPPLHIEKIPGEAKSLALIVEDPDAPNGVFDHWIVWNIEPAEDISEGSNPGVSGDNSAGKSGYHPACPPSGVHRYFFYVFALDTTLDLPVGSKKKEMQAAMDGHVIAQGTLMGTYERNQ
jgi:Raf kinase inhibitor-like YbhB/YbcL family protein